MRLPTLQELYYIIGIIGVALGVLIPSIIYWDEIWPVLSTFLQMLRSQLHVVLLYIAVIYLLCRDIIYRRLLAANSGVTPSIPRNDEGDEHGKGGN